MFGRMPAETGGIVSSDAQWPWGKKGTLFWLVELKGIGTLIQKKKRKKRKQRNQPAGQQSFSEFSFICLHLVQVFHRLSADISGLRARELQRCEILIRELILFSYHYSEPLPCGWGGVGWGGVGWGGVGRPMAVAQN